MASSAATQLFRDFVWQPISPSAKGPSNLPIRRPSNTSAHNENADVLVTAPGLTAGVQQLNRSIRRRLVARRRFKDDHHDTCMFIERSKNQNVVAYTANLVDGKTGAAVASGAKRADVTFKASDPLRAYWVKIEPEHVARRRARGETEDICELNMVERKLAFGCNASLLTKEKFMAEVLPDKAARSAATAAEMEAIALLYDELHPCLCKFVAMSSWPVWMVRLPPLTESTSTATAALDTDDDASPVSMRASREGEDAEAMAFNANDTVVAMLALINGELSVVESVYVSSVEPKRFYQLPKVEYIEVHGTSLATGKPTYEKRTT
ncbi:putative mitochondrial hypothetical protein [Leptomonas pyrrhocoris]|uniref:DUF4833 domain-containing protein n=1 Tax=Leptomonas pyrrhocoris TaxID=157538 RepID=A0A0M9FXX0_LEPPY|nr:putative mitochondrial hypothetical protein [Leptomonas pyrrhocoris]XP_015656663.1 putative mitochondrial hypothetical protein [Leptomonas pyrrhocoris]KPA78223.1 putative mitochondrial hypothetical protein [Leptomonas pyrrhocoris]KPA78224.1 putative mitochondrial hypothetical protein [Leptomonas pyrrhocoris]|eukprot:XP_015656662.1 putative mitochondrial hypothetical protein [Leptomonas pyrrhocoris]